MYNKSQNFNSGLFGDQSHLFQNPNSFNPFYPLSQNDGSFFNPHSSTKFEDNIYGGPIPGYNFFQQKNNELNEALLYTRSHPRFPFQDPEFEESVADAERQKAREQMVSDDNNTESAKDYNQIPNDPLHNRKNPQNTFYNRNPKNSIYNERHTDSIYGDKENRESSTWKDQPRKESSSWDSNHLNNFSVEAHLKDAIKKSGMLSPNDTDNTHQKTNEETHFSTSSQIYQNTSENINDKFPEELPESNLNEELTESNLAEGMLLNLFLNFLKNLPKAASIKVLF